MLRVVVAAAGAAFLLFSGLEIATAQTTANTSAGKPLQLLKVAEQPGKTKAKPHAKLAAKPSANRPVKVAAKRKIHTHIATAGRKRPLLPAQAASTPASDTAGPTARAAAPDEIAAVAPATPATLPHGPAQSEMVVAGQSVKVAAPDDVNEIDLAANQTASQASDAPPVSAEKSAPMQEMQEMQEIVTAAPKADMNAPAPVVAQTPPSPVGSTPWILQVMAALGGAVTAGSVAWFLIGSTPQRTYG
jgi:hypothetical protein